MTSSYRTVKFAFFPLALLVVIPVIGSPRDAFLSFFVIQYAAGRLSRRGGGALLVFFLAEIVAVWFVSMC